MTGTTADMPAIRSNPFPATAVAVLSARGDTPLTISTNAVLQAKSFTDEYVRRSEASHDKEKEPDGGSTIAIVGEYGTGKTHIALGILASLNRLDSPVTHSFYLDAPADTFLALYRDRFVTRLQRKELRQQIEAYLADALADLLMKNKMTAPAVDQLESGKIGPLELVQKMGLIESDLMNSLRARLRLVTKQEDYATALTLLLRPEFEDAVWEWLSGNPPDPVLRERGITATIASEPAALEAIGVFAFLFGRRGHRFVLLIDEMEKVLTGASGRDPDSATILAFKKLMEAIGRTQGLLVLIGLPDYLEALPDDARQRIAVIIRPSPMSPDDIVKYIQMVQSESGHTRLKPFTRDAAGYIAEITGGNARKVVRLCYLAFQASLASGTDVNRPMLREVARDQFESVTQQDVAAEITRIFDSHGWKFERNKVFGTKRNTPKVDFWIMSSAEDSGCGVVLSRSLLYARDIEQLAQARSAVRQTNPNSLWLLVINGYLADNLTKRVEAACDRYVVVSQRDFREDFDAAVSGLMQRLEELGRVDIIVQLSDKVEQLSRQTSFLVDQVDQLRRSVTASDVELAVTRGLRSIFKDLATGVADDVVIEFPRTFQLFSQADSLLKAFDAQITLPDATSTMIRERQARQAPNAISVVVSLSVGLRTFRQQITDTLRRSWRMSDPEIVEAITPICQDADSSFSRLYFELEDVTTHSTPERPNAQLVVPPSLSMFRDFGYRIYMAVRDDVSHRDRASRRPVFE